jgi:hypothetical protein
MGDGGQVNYLWLYYIDRFSTHQSQGNNIPDTFFPHGGDEKCSVCRVSCIVYRVSWVVGGRDARSCVSTMSHQIFLKKVQILDFGRQAR